MERKIQLFKPKFEVDECLAGIRECLEKGWTGIGFKTVEFEEAWKAYTGLPQAHFLNSNTSGLHLALNVFKKKDGWADGDEVITTPLTFVSTNHAILYENLTPVFADVDDTLCLSPASIKERLTSKTRAILYVGFGGNSGEWDQVVALAKKFNLRLILDAAHMAGARYDGLHVGSDADCAIFSFQAVKNLPTADSGMICFADEEDDAYARRLSWLGINKDTYARSESLTGGSYKWLYEVDDLGFKYHGNSIMAAIGLVQLKYLDRDNDRRREISTLYERLLADVKGINFVRMSDGSDSSRHLFQIRVKDGRRNMLMEHLAANGVFAGVHYRSNTEYSMYRRALHTCPEADQAAKELISLPLHMELSDEDVEYIVRVIREGLAG